MSIGIEAALASAEGPLLRDLFAGEVAAAINAVGLALVDAGCPMLDFVCACTVSMIDNTPLLGERLAIIVCHVCFL